MRQRFWIRAAVGIAAAILLGMAVTYGHLLAAGIVNIHLADFLTYYSSSELVLGGHATSIYNFAVMQDVQSRLTAPLRMPGGVSPFIYPPWFAFATAPLSALPYAVAYDAWFAGNIALAIGALVALGRYARLRGAACVVFTLFGLSFLPVFAAFGQGQVSILLLALLVGVLCALRRGTDVLAGVLLAFVLIKPQYALPVAGVLLLQQRWRVVAGFAFCGAMLLLLPLPLFGPGIDGTYVRSLIHLSSLHGTAGYMAPPPINYSLQGAAALLIPAFSTPLRLVLSGCVFGLLLWCGRRSLSVDTPVAVAVLFGLLVSPHVLVYDVSLLLLPIAVLVRRQISWAWLAGTIYMAPLLGLAMHRGVPLIVFVMTAALAALIHGTRSCPPPRDARIWLAVGMTETS